MRRSGEETSDPGAEAAAVRIEPATGDHAEPIATMWGLLGYPTSSADVARRLERLDPDRNRVWTALAGDEVVGWVHVFLSERLDQEPFVELGGLIVAPSWRGRGLGRRLMLAAEDWGRRRGCALFRIRSHEKRGEAHRFYERMGYRRVKRQQVLDKMLDGALDGALSEEESR